MMMMLMEMMMMNIETDTQKDKEAERQIKRQIEKERLRLRLREYREANYSDGEFFGAANQEEANLGEANQEEAKDSRRIRHPTQILTKKTIDIHVSDYSVNFS